MTKRQEKQIMFKQARSTNLRKHVEAHIKKHGTYSNERIANIQEAEAKRRHKYVYGKAQNKFMKGK